MDNQNKDAGLQSDEQKNDLGVIVKEPTSDTPQAPEGTQDPSDKLTPDHPRFKQVYNELQELKNAEVSWTQEKQELLDRLEAIEEKSQQRNIEGGDEELSDSERESLEKIKKHLQKDGFLRQDDLTVYQNTQKYKDLAQKYNGSNGLPKFDRVAVTAHAKKNGFGNNFEAAYRDMHFDTILEVEAMKRAKAPIPPTSEKPTSGGEDAPGTKRLTPKEIDALTPAEYEKYREGLLTAIKPK